MQQYVADGLSELQGVNPNKQTTCNHMAGYPITYHMIFLHVARQFGCAAADTHGTCEMDVFTMRVQCSQTPLRMQLLGLLAAATWTRALYAPENVP